ncbi:hypothetical protein Tco_0766147 [Tanacetum coccineum]
MGRFRSKEDDVSKISTSIFVTNFPDSFSAKDLFHSFIGKSFVSVVKTSRMPLDKESPPAIVLEDDCLNEKDLTLSFMGKVKEMASLVNLKKALCNEGFDVVKISYLGELWVLLEFETAKAKDSFRGFVSHSTKSFKIVFRGKVYWVRASEVLGWTPEFSEEDEEDELSVEDNNDGRINDLEANIMGIVIESGVGRRCLKHCKQKLRFKAFRVTLKYSVLPLNGGSILNLMEEVVKWAKLWDIIMDGCAIKEITRDHGKSQENLGFVIKPSVNRACIDTPFPVSLSIDQKEDMERRISKEEVKRAVWDCGVDKSPGPDGVSSLFALNRGLMLKWVWRFYSQKCSLWTKVIKAIYGEDGNLNKDVSDYIRLKLGNGENTRFWVDNWYEGGAIKELFPRMFTLELNKNATVSSK